MADGGKGGLVQFVGTDLGGEIEGLEYACLALELFVHVQVVECKVAVALVAVGHIGGYHIDVSRAQGHHLAGQMNLCLALGDQKQTGEGRRHPLPVPVGMVAGKPYMEHYQAQRFYRYIHD